MENPICQSRTRKSVGFICVNDPADTIAMVTAHLACEFKFEDRRKHSGNRFGAPAHHFIDIGRFGPKGVKDACPALFNFGRGSRCKTCRALVLRVWQGGCGRPPQAFHNDFSIANKCRPFTDQVIAALRTRIKG